MRGVEGVGGVVGVLSMHWPDYCDFGFLVSTECSSSSYNNSRKAA